MRSTQRSVVLVFVLLVPAAVPIAVLGEDRPVVLRPVTGPAKVEKCTVAKPGHYKVRVGSLIELDYTYPTVEGAIPINVAFRQTLEGAVAPSSLGIRDLATGLIGQPGIVFFFMARAPGTETVWLMIDDAEYKYTFEVEGLRTQSDDRTTPIKLGGGGEALTRFILLDARGGGGPHSFVVTCGGDGPKPFLRTGKCELEFSAVGAQTPLLVVLYNPDGGEGPKPVLARGEKLIKLDGGGGPVPFLVVVAGGSEGPKPLLTIEKKQIELPVHGFSSVVVITGKSDAPVPVLSFGNGPQKIGPKP